MDVLLAWLMSASGDPTPVNVELRARESVTILRAHRASAKSWHQAGQRNQKEIVACEKDGMPVL